MSGAARSSTWTRARRAILSYVCHRDPFWPSRCGYCDFVTVVGRDGEHGRATSTRCCASSSSSAALLAPELESVYLGGGTPTLTEPRALERLLAVAACRARGDGRGEPGDGHARARGAARRARVSTRVSVGAQTFHRIYCRRSDASPSRTTSAAPCYRLRDAGIDNISLDLIYGIPGQKPADLARDLAEALALEPEHLSAYELEAKPGTRFTHAHGAELERQAESMETYFERVVETLTAAGYRWYETANFCRSGKGRTCGRGTTSATGSGGTTSGSAWARSAQSRTGAGGTRLRSPATSPPSRGENGRRVSWRSCLRQCGRPSA